MVAAAGGQNRDLVAVVVEEEKVVVGYDQLPRMSQYLLLSPK